MQRRDFLQNLRDGALLGGAALLTGGSLVTGTAGGAPAPAKPAAGGAKARPQKFNGKFVDYGGVAWQKHLTYYNYEQQAWFRRDNTVVTAYRANAAQKYPYWYPLAGPKSGLSLIAETSQPWPHHRGIFFGCDKVNGGNYWQNALKDGAILSQGFRLEQINETSAVLADRCLWRKPGAEPIVEDTRRFSLRFLDADRYVLDAEFALHALKRVSIQNSNHSLFGVRCSPDISVTGGGALETSTGVVLTKANNTKETAAKIFGKSARWLAFYGKRFGGVTEGVAVFTPEGLPKPFDENKWFFRDYGNISPTPMQFLKKPLVIEQGDTLRLRYRVVAFAGTPADARLNELWEDFNNKKPA